MPKTRGDAIVPLNSSSTWDESAGGGETDLSALISQYEHDGDEGPSAVNAAIAELDSKETPDAAKKHKKHKKTKKRKTRKKKTVHLAVDTKKGEATAVRLPRAKTYSKEKAVVNVALSPKKKKTAEELEEERMAQGLVDVDENARPRDTCYLCPNSARMAKWDIFIILLLLYTATITPYEVGFLGDPKFNFLFLVNRVVDLGFIVDMSFQFFLGFEDDIENRMIYDKQRIMARYLGGWFLIDVMSVIPFDSISFIAALAGNDDAAESLGNLKIMRVVRLLRLIKLLRLMRSSRIIQRQQAKLGWSYVSYSLIKFSCSIVILMHWLACMWAACADMLQPSTYTGAPEHDWVYELSMNTPNPGAWDKYIASIEFSLMAMVFGYGSVEPVGTGQRTLALACMFAGGSVYVYMIGAICEAVSSIDPASTAFKQTMDMLNLYLHDIHCDLETRERFRSYFLKAKELMRHSYYQEVLEKLSPKLRGELSIHCHSDWIGQISFFNCENIEERQRFVVAIAMQLVRCAFTKLETVCIKGEPADALYIIMHGLVGVGGRVKRAGNFFGMEMIQEGALTASMANAITFLDAQRLGHDELHDVLMQNFPQTLKLVRWASFRMCLRHFMCSIGKASLQEQRRQVMAKGLKRMTRAQTRIHQKRWCKKVQRKRAKCKGKACDKQALAERNYDYSLVDPGEMSSRMPPGVELKPPDKKECATKTRGLEKAMLLMEERIEQKMAQHFHALEFKIETLLGNM